MERIKHWRAEPTRSARVHRRNNRGRRLRAVVAVGAMMAVAMPVLSSDAAVGGRRSIEVTTGDDLVILSNYPKLTRVRIQVVRNGTVVGFATKRTGRQGGIELNHTGFRDCWQSRRTPNIRPGDKIRTRILGTRIRDTSVVRGVFINTVTPNPAGTAVEVSGTVRLAGRSAVNPDADVLELRVRSDSDDLREDINTSVNPDGSWTHTISGIPAGEADGAEVVLEWSRGAAADELTVASPGDPAGPTLGIPGCPPVERN